MPDHSLTSGCGHSMCDENEPGHSTHNKDQRSGNEYFLQHFHHVPPYQ
jgi:hypothetical protein